MMEAVSTSEISVYLYETTWHSIPEGCHMKLLDYFRQSAVCLFIVRTDLSFKADKTESKLLQNVCGTEISCYRLYKELLLENLSVF
jgi:hypothetical protein